MRHPAELVHEIKHNNWPQGDLLSTQDDGNSEAAYKSESDTRHARSRASVVPQKLEGVITFAPHYS